MSEEIERTEDTEDTPTTDGVHTEPRGNPEADQDAVDRGLEQLERVKPY